MVLAEAGGRYLNAPISALECISLKGGGDGGKLCKLLWSWWGGEYQREWDFILTHQLVKRGNLSVTTAPNILVSF